MDSWTLQGDSYSFLRSAPRTFSLCHREGTPNHVEIFDIINVPTQRSAISETTCLCDIFGDNCESPSLSSSPAVGTFVPSQREIDETAAASPLVEELNDSSSSYHTAQGSSEGEEGCEDSRERVCSPLFQNVSSERKHSEGVQLPTGHLDIYADTSNNCEPKSNSPVPELNTANPSPGGLDSSVRTPSPGHNSPNTLSSEGRVSSLSSSSLEKRLSPSSPYPRPVDSDTESREITPTFLQRYNSPLHESLTPSTSESRNYDHPSSPHSMKSSPEFMVEVSPEPRSYFNQHDGAFSEPTFNNFSLDCTGPAFDSRAIKPSPEPSPTCAELSSQSKDALLSPELKNRPDSPDTQQSPPFPEQGGRISLPDLFSRGSSPDIEDVRCSPELISAPSPEGRDCSPTTENAPLTPELVRTVSTPSPAISTATSSELAQSSVSPILKHKTPSPGLLSAASSCTTGTRTPSPKITHISISSEIRTLVPSPVTSYSLTQSPEIRSSCSPRGCIYTAPSPEIRVTGSSPDISRRDRTSEADTMSASPPLETHFDSFSSRSPTSSPHITGISYTVVQPEDRDTPPFPELSHLSSPEPKSTPEGRITTPNRDIIEGSVAESAGASQNSPHASGSTHSEITLTHPTRYQTPSPQAKHHTPSPESTYNTPLSKTYQCLSPEHMSGDLSPIVSPEQRFYQHSPTSRSTEYNLQYMQPNLHLRHTPESDRDVFAVDLTEIQNPDNNSPSYELDSNGKSVVTEIKISSPVQAIHSPVSISPFTSEVKEDSSHKQLSQEREATLTEVQKKSSLPLFPETEQDTSFYQKDIYQKSFDVKCTSPDCIVVKDKNINTSPVNRLMSSSPVQPYCVTSEMSSLSKSTCASKQQRRQFSNNDRSENRESFIDNVTHHVNKRRTPSPPLTRFTPVHILAPEKPYRQWQNRSHSSSQVVAFSPSGKLKKDVTNRESPSAPGDSNSHDHWVRLGRQLDMEQKMQLEDEREVHRERQWDREIDRERKREEQVPEKGGVRQGDTSYRGEQVELSFNARNRKGPVSRNTAPTSREILQGLPAVHSYSESLPATRQLQQQQKLLRLASQQDTRVGGPGRGLKPSASQNKKSSPGNVAASRPCRSSSSSMGSELDEADNEVKWFTDVAFRSLSSPEVDYLDMYNSSHRSSTNISQPSTQESPAGVSASLLAYADFRGSAPKLDNDELSFQQPTAHYSDGLDPSRRYEMGSFECVDVAIEREDFRKVRRGVPKRQIQLKRKNANTEGKQDESSEKSSPGVPLTQGSPSPGSQSMEKFTRQHSTPAAMQDCYQSVENLEPTLQSERKSKLQKSLSLNETGSKTKMATCLIKSVLSKKMQNVDKQTDEQTGEEGSPDFEQKSTSAVAPLKDSSKLDVCNDVGHLRGESRTMGETKPGKGFGVRSSSRPSSSSSSKSVTFSHTGSEEADSQDTNATSLKSEVRSELKVQKSRAEVQLADDHKLWDKREAGDSANATPQNTGVPFNTEARQQIITTDQECQNAEDRKQLQRDEYKSKTQETASKTVEKKKTSLNVCLTPEAENKPEASSANVLFTEKEDTTEISGDDKTEEEEEGNGTIKAKVPIHKVRDVRRIVKNTYNLSFKATTAALSPEVNEEEMENCNVAKNPETKKERQNGILKGEEKELSQEMWQEEREEKKEEMKVEKKEEQREVVKHITPPPPLQSKGKTSSHPQPIQIEYKAVCKKESAYLSDKTQASPELVTELSRGSQQSSNATIQNYTTQDAGVANVAGGTESATEICKAPGTRDKSVVIRTDRKPPMLGSLPRVPSKEREVSTAVVIIRDGSSKTKTASSLSQEDVTALFQAAAVSPIPGPNSTGGAPSNSGHSVSMLLKEKGYHADIGAVMGDSQIVAGRKAVLPKHVNSLEIPLQTAGPAEDGQVESHRQRTFSSSSNMSDNTDTLSKTREDEGSKPAVKETSKQKRASPLRNAHEQAPPMAKQKELGDFEAVKRLDPTFPPRSPALRRFRPQPIEVKSLSKETQKDEMPSPGNTRPQTIEVKSIAKNSQKPIVPPKPTCRFKPSDLGVTASEGQRPPATSSVSVKPQDEERSQTIVVSSPTIYRKISNESLSTPNYTRKLAVSAVSSLKPPPSKTTATTVSSLSKQSPGPSETEACIGRGEQQQVAASPQSSRNTQRLPALPTAPTSVTDPGASINSAQATVSDATANQVPGPAAATASQPSQSAVMDADNQQQYTRTARPQEQAMAVTSNNTKQPAVVSTTQVPGYTQQSSCRSLSCERPQRSDDLHFYTTDDPPSYDERESFSPLILPDLTPRRSTRYQPSSRPPPCSCSASRPSHPGVTPPHHHRSPHEPTPPVPTHSPGQALPYPMAQPPLRPHQCRPDHQPISYQRVSPKSIPLGPGHPPTLYPPLHQPPPCPPHPSLLQTCPADRPLQPAQHIDPRRPPVHRSPQQQLPVMAGTHYNDPGHSHSPGLPPMDPQYLCGPSTLGPTYGSEYGGDSSSLYSEGSYGQTPRRVLMDPETGKYFYIEMPVQPLRKMLFDPETGQYVEVLIPQQAVSHSGLYPPAAAPYPPLHNPSMYASAPQYMPYAAPPPPAHPQSQPQPPRYPEAPATATMHASGSGMSFRNPSGQGSKPEPQNHPPLDQSYLESMYYVPTGMNASPNPTPPDYYHKRPPNLPPGGKRS